MPAPRADAKGKVGGSCILASIRTYVSAKMRLIPVGLALGVAAAAALAVVTAARVWRSEGPLASPIVVAQVGETTLRVNPAYAASPESRGGGKLERIDLAFRFPGFAPIEPRGVAADALVFLRLEPADGVLSPEDRPAKLYVRFLEPEQWSHPGGLLMRRFEDSSPYAHEELYFAPPEGRLFAARCTRPRQPPDGLAESCLDQIRVNSLDVTLRFTPDILGDWEALVNGTRTFIERVSR